MLKLSMNVAIVYLISTPALAADSWNCTFLAFDGPPGITSHVTIQVDGDKLDWLLASYDIPNPKIHIVPSALHYRVMENNGVGIVAVSSQARTDKEVGSVINSETIAIDKTTGVLRAGVVGTNGVHDNLSGACRQK
jgi:hypothetical protein